MLRFATNSHIGQQLRYLHNIMYSYTMCMCSALATIVIPPEVPANNYISRRYRKITPTPPRVLCYALYTHRLKYIRIGMINTLEPTKVPPQQLHASAEFNNYCCSRCRYVYGAYILLLLLCYFGRAIKPKLTC